MAFRGVTVHSGNPDNVRSSDIGAFQAAAIGTEAYILSGCVATMPNANTVSITAGYLLAHGRLVAVTPSNLTIENGNQGQMRADLVCLQYDYNPSTKVETFSGVVVKGVPGTTAIDPGYADASILDNPPLAQIPLWRVTLNGISPTVARIASGSPSVYSTTETMTGETWIDGKPIYRKVVNVGGVYENNEARIDHGITGLYQILKAYGFANGIMIPSSYANAATQAAYGIGLTVTSTQVQVFTGASMPLTAPVFVVVEYIKAS